MMRIVSILCATSLLACPLLLAKTKHAPLPDQILHAKTLYIDNQSGIADINDKAYDELTKWGRFKILPVAKDADLVLLVSASAYVSGYNTRSTGTVTDHSIDVDSQTTAKVGQTTYLTVIDPKTGDALWSDLTSNGGGRGLVTSLLAAHAAANGVRGLVKELRGRIEEQQGNGKSK